MDKTQLNKFEQAGRNPFDAPIPGEGLTQSPEQKFPWEQPPQMTQVDDAIKEVFINITEKNTLVELLNLLNNGQPVDEIAQIIAHRGVTEGKFNPDLMLLLLEPLMYLIIAIAEEYEIDPVIYEGMDNDIAGKEDVNKAISAKKVKEIRKDSVPSSILARVKDLPSEEELGMEE